MSTELFYKKSALVYKRIGGEAISFNESSPACEGSGSRAAEGGSPSFGRRISRVVFQVEKSAPTCGGSSGVADVGGFR